MENKNFKSKSGIDSWIYFNLLKGARNLKFFEAGANDGITDSITYAFEKEFGWQGYLVEPQDILFRQCVQNRNPQNRFFKCRNRC